MAIDKDVGHSGRVNSDNSLLQPVPEGGDWRNTAIIGGHGEDDGALAMGFLAAAEIVVARWKSGRRNDLLALPILSLYRHGIELALKDGIREAAARLRADGVSDPDLLPEALNDRLSRTHSIGDLVKRLDTYLGRLQLGPDNQLPADTVEVLNSLHLLDEKGQTFRYSTVKTGSGKNWKLVPARPDQQHFDLVTLAATLNDVGTLVLHGVSGVLGAYAEYQAEMRRETGDWAS